MICNLNKRIALKQNGLYVCPVYIATFVALVDWIQCHDLQIGILAMYCCNVIAFGSFIYSFYHLRL